MPEHDVLVVGGGYSGMSAAIAAKTTGADAALLSKVYPLRSHSSGSHSGINAALGGGDSWESHAEDTIKAGGYLADQDAVEILCREGIDDVIRLEHLGVIFSRDEQGGIDLMSFPASSRPRTCYVGDSAGHIILQVLYEQLLRHQVTTYNEWFVTSLLIEDGTCRGVIAQELSSGEVQPVYAKSVVLATGGLGRMYQLNTSAFTATADGAALAYQAGVPLMDMEMVQYHPTTLKGTGMVVTEAARGQGAYLVNNNGDRFMSAYSPQGLEMTSRDLTARAVATEIDEGRGTDGCVFLDFQHIAEERLDDLLPETRLLVKRLGGINLQKELVPIRPAMHRPIGGIQTDVNGATSLAGLYAAGESACVGVHGANRLGGNSLLESAVFGRRAGESAARHAKSTSVVKASESLVKDQDARIKMMASRSGGEDTIGSVRRELAKTMHEQVGIYRDAQGLSAALDKVKDLKSRYQRVGIPSASGTYNPSLATLLELENMLEVAHTIVASALAREESRGAHHRNDFPQRDDANWSRHTIASQGPDGPNLHYKPVVITQWSP